jgi:hypothetical protein
MNRKPIAVLKAITLCAAVAAVAVARAQTSTTDFKGEPDKSMAAAHESFIKGNTRKASEDISKAALKKADAGLEGAAKWSGTQLSEGTKASIDAMKKAGHGTATGVKAGADQADKWFKDIGDGITDLGHKL